MRNLGARGADHDMVSTCEKWSNGLGGVVTPRVRRGEVEGGKVEAVGGATPLFMCTVEHYALTTRCVIGKLTNNLFITQPYCYWPCWLVVK